MHRISIKAALRLNIEQGTWNHVLEIDQGCVSMKHAPMLGDTSGSHKLQLVYLFAAALQLARRLYSTANTQIDPPSGTGG